MTQKTVKLPSLLDYITLAIYKNYMIWILVTSSAQGKIPSMGFDYGAGKSTFALRLLWSLVYARNWEKVKANTIGAYWQIKPILDRPHPTNGVLIDDMQLTLGKHQQHNPEIKELAYYLTTVRPYVKVWIATAPHRDMLQKDFRELFHFEIICPRRGVYEVQQLKRWIDFKRPTKVKERLKYRGEFFFSALPPDIQKWYDNWRHENNKMIRQRLGVFKGMLEKELHLDRLSDTEKQILDNIAQKGFVRYETLHDKGVSHIAMRLKRKGWLELDSGRRYMLTEKAEDVFFNV